MDKKSNPKIICFLCKWCTSTGADLAGTLRMQYEPHSIPITVMCSSRIDANHILGAFKDGADGVFIGGCHPGDCHYGEGNYKALRRFRFLHRMLSDMGIEPERLRLEWISAAEGDKVKSVINDMVEKLKALGPLDLPGRFQSWDGEVMTEGEAQAHGELEETRHG